MATIIKEIEVDVSQLNRFAAIVAKQYDKQSRFLKVTLLDSGERIKVESASTAVINARREDEVAKTFEGTVCLLYTSPSPRDLSTSRMPSSA